MRLAMLLTCALVLSTSACARPTPPTSATSASRVLATPGSGVAPRGRVFDARLDTNLDAQRAEPGDPVQAHLDEPLLAHDGSVIAPRGTPMVGRVVSASRDAPIRITIRIDGLLVGGRVYRIDSRVRWAESARVSHPEPASEGGTVANIYPEVAPRGALPTAVGGGPPPEVAPLTLPRGTKIQLVLLRPFALGAPLQSAPGDE